MVYVSTRSFDRLNGRRLGRERVFFVLASLLADGLGGLSSIEDGLDGLGIGIHLAWFVVCLEGESNEERPQLLSAWIMRMKWDALFRFPR